MGDPVSVTAWIDFLDPWSWVAMTRLERVAEHYGDRVALDWRPFMREPRKRRRDLEEWRKATAEWLEPAAAEPGLQFSVWATQNPPPTHSAPALAAALVAREEDPDRAAAYRRALFRAHFAENRTLSDGATLIALAREVGIDEDGFAMGLRGRYSYFVTRVVEEHNTGAERGVKATPAVVIGDEFLVRGAATEEQYRDLVDQVLAARGDGSAPGEAPSGEPQPADDAQPAEAAKADPAEEAKPAESPEAAEEAKPAESPEAAGEAKAEPAEKPEAGAEPEPAPSEPAPSEPEAEAPPAAGKAPAKKAAKKAPAKKKRPAKKSGAKKSGAKKSPAKKGGSRGGRKAPAKARAASAAAPPAGGDDQAATPPAGSEPEG